MWKLASIVLATAAVCPAADPDLTGIWSPSRATGPGAPAPPTPIVVKPAYKATFDGLTAKIREASARGEQYATKGLCSPYGMPTMLQVAVYPMEVLQSPTQVTLIGEAFSEVRRIYMGKKQLPLDDIAPGYYGHSVGLWDGDTLVVDTIGIKTSEYVPIDRFGTPHTDKLHIVERIRKVSPKELRVEYRVEDTGAFTTAWDAVAVFHPYKDWDEQTCSENNIDHETGKPMAVPRVSREPMFLNRASDRPELAHQARVEAQRVDAVEDRLRGARHLGDRDGVDLHDQHVLGPGRIEKRQHRRVAAVAAIPVRHAVNLHRLEQQRQAGRRHHRLAHLVRHGRIQGLHGQHNICLPRQRDQSFRRLPRGPVRGFHCVPPGHRRPMCSAIPVLSISLRSAMLSRSGRFLLTNGFIRKMSRASRSCNDARPKCG